MTSNSRHGLPPRLMAHQPTRFATAQESKPSPSPGIRMRRGKFRILGFGPRLASLRKVLPASFFMAGLVFPRDDTTVHPMKQLSCRFDCFFRRSTNCASSTRSVCAARWFLAELLIFYAVNDGERAVNAAEPELDH